MAPEPLRFEMSGQVEDEQPVDIVCAWKTREGVSGEDKFVIYPRHVPPILLLRLGELTTIRITDEVMADSLSPVMRVFRAAFGDEWDRFFDMLADPDKNIDAETGLMPLFRHIATVAGEPRPTTPSGP